MLCGVKFCGGCNPRYNREKAYERIKLCFAQGGSGAVSPGGADNEADRTGESLLFDFAREGVPCDILLVIGGCPACCASCSQYDVKGGVLKMWEEEQVEEIIEKLNQEYTKRAVSI